MKNKYQVIIIGAGIGGLVCGCYLAKEGLKVLIVEQHYNPGGYCGSFKRKDYVFDVGPHYLGSLREPNGTLFEILNDLDLLGKLEFKRSDPTDKIITPDKTIFIRKEHEKTKAEFISHFPKEKESINKFFDFVINRDTFSIIGKTKKLTFKQVLDEYFEDDKLKSILSMPLGSLGLPASQASALGAIILYREFIFDGGYYPCGGMQAFSNKLAEQFSAYGGDLLLSTRVSKIISKNNEAIGIKTDKEDFLNAKVIVSNADAQSTFSELLDFDTEEKNKVNLLKVSPSAFVIYLGLKKKVETESKNIAIWFYSNYNIEKCYAKKNFVDLDSFDSIICTISAVPNFEQKSVVRAFVIADYKNPEFWKNNKDEIANKLIFKLEKIIPNIKDHIEVKEVGGPDTFFNFTSNKRGALFGWQTIPSQIEGDVFSSQTSVKNLYLVGHWVTTGVGNSGIPTVAFLGKHVASRILKN